MIEVSKVSKSFGGYSAVKDVSFNVEEGEIFGILGPNGAGKTTLISMLSTAIIPDSGEITIFGLDVSTHAKEIRRSIGVIFQNSSLDDKLTCRENLWISASLYGVSRVERLKRIQEKLELVGLDEWENTLVKKLSWGMKRRLEIARALISNPKVLLMDEPTLGLDPKARFDLWEHLENLGVTVVLSTNYMEEADRLCNKIALMDAGRLVAIDTPQDLKNTIKGDAITLRVRDYKKIASKLKEEYASLKVVGEKIIIYTGGGEGEVSRLVRRIGEDLVSIEMRQPNLNDVFLEYTGKELRSPELNEH
jgi:ABC-2 type transport system ATP-binding protein